MFAVSTFAAAFAGAAVVLGLSWTLLPLLDPKRWLWRSLLLAATTFLAWRYMVWRFAETVAPLGWSVEAIVSWTFAILEALTIVSSSLAFIILSRVKERSAEADANRAWWKGGTPPRVDVYIATYNEEAEVLERTIVGALGMAYAHKRVFVLDDGRRPWLAATCERLGAGYIARPDNAHAKAGNINYALALRTAAPDRPDFVAVLDADFIPHRDFVDRALALFHDAKVGLVQTPQHFFNADPVQHNLGISRSYPDEQRHFFDNVEPARDAWGIAICCGTSSMVRVAAVESIGRFPTDSVTEDFLLTLRLAENGWSTVYLNEPLTEGLAPEGVHEYVVQRGRWCLGLMQIVRNVYNPFGRNGLDWRHRLGLIDSFLYWTTTFPFRLASLLCPLLYWWFGITVVNASVETIIAYYVPYYIAVMATLNWLSRGLFVPILNDVGQLLAAWPITRAIAMGLFQKGPHKFKVTAKGGDRTKTVVQWPLMKPFVILLALTVGGLIVPLLSDFTFNTASNAGDGRIVVLFWTVYNIAVLGVAIAACVERPRMNRPQRQTAEPVTVTVGRQVQRGWLVDIGLEDAHVSGPMGLEPGTALTIALREIGTVEASVIAATPDGYQVALMPTAAQRAALITKLHTARATPGTDKGDVALMVRELSRALRR